VAQDLRELLHNEADVAQRHVLDLRLAAQQRDQRRRHLLRQRRAQRLVLDHAHLLQHHLRARGAAGSPARAPSGAARWLEPAPRACVRSLVVPPLSGSGGSLAVPWFGQLPPAAAAPGRGL